MGYWNTDSKDKKMFVCWKMKKVFHNIPCFVSAFFDEFACSLDLSFLLCETFKDM